MITTHWSVAASSAARVALAAAASLAATLATAQAPTPGPPTVTVTASANATVPNDRLQAWLRAESENASAAAAASQVNATVAKALAMAKAYPTVKVATAGYSTYQVGEQNKPARWHVSQSITLDATDFTAAATLITKLQDEGGMLLSNMGFSLSDKARHDAEDSVTQQAIKSWQERSQRAAQGLGFGAWRTGRVTVQASEGGRVYPVARAQAMSMQQAAPVAVEAGTSDVTVTVTGDAVLEQPLAR
jgi:predicted secreted protein